MIERIVECFPDFLEGNFKSYVDNVYIQICLADMEHNLEKIKHFVSEDVYQKLEKKNNDLKVKGLTQMYDGLNVGHSTIVDSEVFEDKVLVKVYVISKYLDYVVDGSGNFVRGNKDEVKEKYHYLTFERKKGTDDKELRKCRSCGASVDVNANGKCKFCGTIYDLEEDGWVLVSFEVY